MDSDNPDIDTENAVAIIGMACRLPGASNVAEYWENLVNGVESLTMFTDEELLESGLSPELIQSPNYVKTRGIVDGAGDFDASFFGFTPRDAELLDPQQRIFLECAWHALEDGGYVPTKTDARIGVFGGVGTNWHLGDVNRHPAVKKYANAASVVTSNDKDYVTTRVSYKLNLTGPSVNVQCACSTSVVSALLGAASLTSYQSDLVLAGGATIEIPEHKGYLYQNGGLDSPDGRCRPFDAKAAGTVFSRGSAVLLLKRLGDAISDGDNIHAVILDGAVNNDGSDKVGFTAPSVNGQVEVGIEAFERAEVSPTSISFVEAHGTATALGDPVEVASLSQIFGRKTDQKQFCALGSVKGNIGHTDVAAGAASMIKTAMSLKHGTLPASVNCDTPNPEIDFPNTPFFVNTELRSLRRGAGPLRALLNSFGVGGTNACAILQEPPENTRTGAPRAANVVVFSAKSETALEAMTADAASHIAANPDVDLDDLAYTSQVGRADFPHRRYVVNVGREDLLERLTDRKPGGRNHEVCPPDERRLVFAFPGQGNQYVGMGAGLYESESAYREAIDAVCEALGPVMDMDLRDVMYADPGDDAVGKRLNDTDVTQPAIFATNYAVAKMFMSWGIQPGALIGHSVGEYVAAVLAGVLSLKDGAVAVARRGQLIQALPQGSMLAILQPESEITEYLTSALSVAAVNSPKLTVVAGPTPDIQKLEATLKSAGIFASHLDTSHAFHSSMMDPALGEFAGVMNAIPLAPPNIPIISTVTGGWMTAEQATDPDYWVQHVRRPVRFSDGLMTLFNGPEPSIVLECGPGHSLASAAKSQLSELSLHAVVTTMGSQSDTGSGLEHAMGAVGALWAAGRPIQWPTLYQNRQPRRVSMPGYPFERQRFLLTGAEAAEPAVRKIDQKNPDMSAWFYLPAWRRTAAPELLATPEPEGETNSSETWLILEDGEGVGSAMAHQIRDLGEQVILVRRGDAFESVDANTWVIRSGVADDYHALLGSLRQAARVPSRIVHLWNVAAAHGLPEFETLDESQALAFYSPLFLEQALVKHNVIDGVRLVVAASGVFDVAGEGVLDPVRALAIGPARVWGREFPGAQGRFVDVDLPATADQVDILAANLIAETRLGTAETLAAYRNGYRWVESFEQVPLADKDGLGTVSREGGVYLISGGLGGLGLIVAQRIAEAMAGATLILTHRAPMLDRGEWDAWLSDHTGNDTTSERIRGIRALESAGANVVAVQADSGDMAAMGAVVDDAVARFGAIHGVVHAAGVAGSGIISLKTPEMAADVLNAKVRGTMILDQLFQDKDLDFFVLFSSISSILGEAGRVDYCAANSFMDAVAQSLRAKRPWSAVSIDWPSWAEIGMAARWQKVKTRRGVVPVSRDEDGPELRFAGAEEGEEFYDVLVIPETDWIISDHFVFGIPTMVGTGFLDLMARFSALKNPGSTAVLENTYFISPLMFEPDTDRRVRLTIVETGDKYRFSFKSQRNGPGGHWQEHFRGTVQLPQTPAPSAIDVAALVARFDGEIDDSPFYRVREGDDAPYLELGPRWEALHGLRIGDGEWLAAIELPDEFSGDLVTYPHHPALTDVALAAAVKHVAEGAYLPTGYRQVHMIAPLTETFWSHIRLNGEAGPEAETMSYDVTFLDPDGRVLVEVKEYSLKRVTATGKASGADPGSVSTTPGKASAGMPESLSANPTDLLPGEGVDALARILAAPSFPQVVVSTRDLDALIEEENNAGAKSEDSDDEGAAEAPTHARPSLSTPYEAPANAIEEAVAEIWQGILGISQIGANDDFTEIGGNSLLAVQATAITSDTFSVDLAIDSFTKNPTVRGLAEAVMERLVSMASEETLEEMISELDEV